MIGNGSNSPRIEAGEQLRPLLDRALNEGELTITRDGVPVARIVPFLPPPDGEASQEAIDEAVAWLEEFSSSHSLGGLSWKELRDEGRKW